MRWTVQPGFCCGRGGAWSVGGKAAGAVWEDGEGLRTATGSQGDLGRSRGRKVKGKQWGRIGYLRLGRQSTPLEEVTTGRSEGTGKGSKNRSEPGTGSPGC